MKRRLVFYPTLYMETRIPLEGGKVNTLTATYGSIAGFDRRPMIIEIIDNNEIH